MLNSIFDIIYLISFDQLLISRSVKVVPCQHSFCSSIRWVRTCLKHSLKVFRWSLPLWCIAFLLMIRAFLGPWNSKIFPVVSLILSVCSVRFHLKISQFPIYMKQILDHGRRQSWTYHFGYHPRNDGDSRTLVSFHTAVPCGRYEIRNQSS